MCAMIRDDLQRLLAAGWTQHRIAKATGIAQPSIARILAGKQTDVRHSAGKKLSALVALLPGRAKAPANPQRSTSQRT